MFNTRSLLQVHVCRIFVVSRNIYIGKQTGSARLTIRTEACLWAALFDLSMTTKWGIS